MNNQEETVCCRTCKTEKPRSKFAPSYLKHYPGQPYALMICKKCSSRYSNRRYKAPKYRKEQQERSREYYRQNRLAILEKNKLKRLLAREAA